VDVGTAWRVLGFTAFLAGLTCLLFGLAPALRATSVAPCLVLKERGRGTTGGRSGFGLRRILVVSQIALSLMLGRNEIGIRMALGAGQQNIIRLVLRETGVLLLIGLAAGVALALATARTAASMLFGLKPTDVLTYVLAVASLSAIAALASFLPTRQAARLDPMVALRNE